MMSAPRPPAPDADGAPRRRSSSRWRAIAVAVAALLIVPVAPAVAAPAAPTVAAAWAGDQPNAAGGVDYYLDATGGDDAASGTSEAEAWQSLEKANATTFEPGDRLLLKAGETWSDGSLWPKGSGTAEAPITLDAYGDPDARRPYIATNGQVPSPFSSNGVKNPETVGLTGAVILRNQQHWQIANLEVSNDDDFETDITTGSYVRDGIAVSINADLLGPDDEKIMRGISIRNVFAHNIDGPSTWQRIHYGGINFQVFGSKEYSEYETGAYYFQDIVIEDNTFEMVELHAIQFAFNWFGASEGRTDETGKFHEGWEQLWVRDRDLYSRDVYIANNYAKDIGQGPYQFANTKDMIVEYNEANGWLQRYNQVSAGLYLWAGADTVMRFNEVYDGPANEYDATPWDLEFTNFDVVYEYNYSHNNKGGWMSYMGNSSNSIARYNLSVNDNGVIFKNMLSTNYTPTYILNNVFVYDGEQLDYFHDEVLKDTVYFANNVFYNTSTTTSTPWFRKQDALSRGVFSNNAYYEASGVPSPQQPADAGAVTADPMFVGNPADYAQEAGVANIRDSASLFRLQEDSPLRDAGRYNPRVGTADFFGTPIYYGDGVDIGIHEAPIGEQVIDPVDTDPIEDEIIDTRVNLALGKPIVASSTHPANNFGYSADMLVDGDRNTRWAAGDDATYPLTIDIDFGEPTTFDEVLLDEFTDSGTPYRTGSWQLQQWDPETEEWTTFVEGSDGLGRDRSIRGFDEVTTSRLRLAITGLLPGQIYAPTLTEFQVYSNAASDSSPTVSPGVGLHDRAASMADEASNVVRFDVDLDGDELTTIRYRTTSGALVGSLDADDYTTEDIEGGVRITLTEAFYADKLLGTSGLQFAFAGNRDATPIVDVEIVDSTGLEVAIAEARGIAPVDTDEYRALLEETERAAATLQLANRSVEGTGNGEVTSEQIVSATAALRTAIDAVAVGEKAESRVELTVEPSETVVGSVTIRAEIDPASAGGVVDFTLDGEAATDAEAVALAALVRAGTVAVEDGSALWQLEGLEPGAYEVTAAYSGDATTLASSASAAVTVTAAPGGETPGGETPGEETPGGETPGDGPGAGGDSGDTGAGGDGALASSGTEPLLAGAAALLVLLAGAMTLWLRRRREGAESST